MRTFPVRNTTAVALAALAAAVLSGCATSQTDTAARCDLMVRKDVPGAAPLDECIMWSMSPSRRQAFLSEQNRLLDPYLDRGATVQYPWSKPR